MSKTQSAFSFTFTSCTQTVSLVIHLISNSVAIYAAAYLVNGINFNGNWLVLLFAGLVMGAINFFVKPVLKLIAFPFILITFGLFTLVINMALLWTVDLLVKELTIETLLALFWGTVIISVVNFTLSHLIPKS